MPSTEQLGAKRGCQIRHGELCQWSEQGVALRILPDGSCMHDTANRGSLLLLLGTVRREPRTVPTIPMGKEGGQLCCIGNIDRCIVNLCAKLLDGSNARDLSPLMT